MMYQLAKNINVNNNALQKVENSNEQAIIQLLNIADMAINRTYLTECVHYDVVPLARNEKGLLPIDFTSCTKLFRLKRFVYNPEESIMEKLKTFYLSLSHLPLNPSVFMVIKNELPHRDSPQGVFSVYLGIRTEKTVRSHKIQEMLKESFLGTFLGSEMEAVNLSDISLPEKPGNLACVSAMPSVKKDTDNETAQIGMEQFIDVMRNKEYTAILVAAPVTSTVVQQRKRDLENLYTKLSIGRKQTLSFGENQSESVSKGINKSIGSSTTSSKSFTHTKSNSSTETHGGGSSDTYGSSSSSSFSYGSGGGSSSGSNSSHTTSSNWSNSQTISFSDSEGTSTSEGTSESETVSKGTSKQFTIECENKNVVNMLEKIDDALKHITESEAYGLWECAAYFTAQDSATALFAANSYKALVLGDTSASSSSYITCWEVPVQREQNQSEESFNQIKKYNQNYIADLFSYVKHGLHPALLHSKGYYGNDQLFREIIPTQAVCGKDLPYFLAMPLKSVPGIVVDSIASFERSVHVKKLDKKKITEQKKERIRLGCVFHMGLPEESSIVSLELDKFTSHCFISGSTGSGKSNTMARLLEEIISREEQKVNFLIIEPAKGEYKKDFHEVPGINIFSTNPLCEQLLHLNPFRFYHGIHVLEHVDRLLNIFGSCWELTAAMPAILKKAVEQSYENMGWDLCNSYYIGDGEKKYPTFATVVTELRKVIDESDYSAEAKGNYTGALVTRVESLAGGILKRIFCSETDIPYETLFNSRTIIDLSRLGAPETKTLIMGVLVMLLSEYRMAVAQETNATNQALQHITVIEEAHNLLKNTQTYSGGGDLIAKSIEMLSNAIAEMRTYGEGFIIVDQSPTAVDISAIKNTNTKIVMRLPEQHDCEAMGNAMGLNEFQQKEIAKLLPGKAIVMQNDWTAAVMVAIDKAKNNFSGQPEIISQDGNRNVRGTLALAFAGLAKRFYNALTTDAALTPDMLVDGITIIDWWEKTLAILSNANAEFEKDSKNGIGKAKASELRGLCHYYCDTLRMLTLPKKEIIPCFGRLIVAILECESCWKIYISKNKHLLQKDLSTENLDLYIKNGIATSENRHTKRISLSLRNILGHYVPNSADSEMHSLCCCVKGCITCLKNKYSNDLCTLTSLGGNLVDWKNIKEIMQYDNLR